jgi:hypothetical protein
MQMNKILRKLSLKFFLIFAVLYCTTSIGTADFVILDDLIVDGSECVGFDCVNGESFSFDTLILKENNLRILFNDTSSAAAFPKNDWRIIANDSANGGLSHFSIQDATAGKQVFTVEAGAPANSLYVDDSGRVGFGTNNPYVELHIADGDTPTVRLDQDGSSGWAPQRWDVAGNESNFFIRDVTNGSKLPFRIQPNTPSSTLTMRADGRVGIGTWSPDYTLEVETTGTGASIVANRTDGATMEFSASGNYGIAGTRTNHPLKLRVDTTDIVQINKTGHYLEIKQGPQGYYDGTWTNASSRDYKENIEELSTKDAINAVENLKPVTYNYKTDKKESHVGFIAEDVPELVAKEDRKGMSPMDVVAVLTKVVQQQQKTIKELNERLEKLEEYNKPLNSIDLLSGI